MNLLVAGAGYIGLPLALAFKERGHRVWGWVYSPESAHLVRESGVEVVCGDLADSEIWRALPVALDAIFYCPSTSGGGVESYRRVHGVGLDQALRFLPTAGRIFYTSSTSVYGQMDGSDVDELSETRPGAEGSKVLLEAERKVLERKGNVLRLAGIYGPDRCVYLKKIREGRAVIEGEGARWVNQIHRQDAVSALEFLWDRPEQSGVWNVADNEAVSVRNLYRWICEKTHLPMPVSGVAEGERKRGLTHKRVLNKKLRGLGWRPGYPTFREGYAGLV